MSQTDIPDLPDFEVISKKCEEDLGIEEDLNNRLQFLLEHIFGIEFELIDAELCEYKLSPTSESVTIVSNYIDNQIYNFSLNPESTNLSTISNVPTFLVHIETMKRILKKQQKFANNLKTMRFLTFISKD